MGQKLSVTILSDNRLLRESLGRILARKGEFEIVLSQCLSDFDEAALPDGSQVVILDSLEFLILKGSLLQQEKPSSEGSKVLLIAMEEDEQVFLRAVRAGASGFIPKDASAMDVVCAVRAVTRGEAVCPPRLCKLLFDMVATQPPETPSARVKTKLGLTRREQQLLPMIGRGLTNKDIARELNLSEQTVKNHVHRILYKVGAENRLEIMDAVRAQAPLN